MWIYFIEYEKRNNIQESLFVFCLFVFLALQPIVVVVSQPGSGL
jgi:hypothetical protein